MPSSGMWRRVDILLTDVNRQQPPAHAGSSLAYFLYSEDGGDTFLRNVS
jgi:hypothetical protein